MWNAVLTQALGIFFGLGAFAGVLALVITLVDRQERRREERKEITESRARIRTLEIENERLMAQLNPRASTEEDEDYMMMASAEPPAQEAPRELVVTVDVREVTDRAAVSDEPRPTRYERIDDNDPPV